MVEPVQKPNVEKERLTLRAPVTVNIPPSAAGAKVRVYTPPQRSAVVPSAVAQHDVRHEKPIGARSVARLYALQAVYQLSMTGGGDAQRVIDFFSEHVIDKPVDGEVFVRPNYSHFRLLVRATAENMPEIDLLIAQKLNGDWGLDRLDKVILSLLRAACAEMFFVPESIPQIVVSEFVSIATTFFQPDGVRIINGLLHVLMQDCLDKRKESMPEMRLSEASAVAL